MTIPFAASHGALGPRAFPMACCPKLPQCQDISSTWVAGFSDFYSWIAGKLIWSPYFSGETLGETFDGCWIFHRIHHRVSLKWIHMRWMIWTISNNAGSWKLLTMMGSVLEHPGPVCETLLKHRSRLRFPWGRDAEFSFGPESIFVGVVLVEPFRPDPPSCRYQAQSHKLRPGTPYQSTGAIFSTWRRRMTRCHKTWRWHHGKHRFRRGQATEVIDSIAATNLWDINTAKNFTVSRLWKPSTMNPLTATNHHYPLIPAAIKPPLHQWCSAWSPQLMGSQPGIVLRSKLHVPSAGPTWRRARSRCHQLHMADMPSLLNQKRVIFWMLYLNVM